MYCSVSDLVGSSGAGASQWVGICVSHTPLGLLWRGVFVSIMVPFGSALAPGLGPGSDVHLLPVHGPLRGLSSSLVPASMWLSFHMQPC